jgi:tRNA G18 (ribose-2'-O)-methylase SpoU
MAKFVHQRHKSPTPLARPRELVVACPPMRSNINFSRIVRVAGCCGVERVVACGNVKPDRKIARDAVEQVAIDSRRTLPPALKTLKSEGYRLVGLEQADNSQNLHRFSFPRRCVLVIGHERLGLADEVLALMDDVVEIPVYGMPFSYNAATAAAMAMYEYCRQYPDG